MEVIDLRHIKTIQFIVGQLRQDVRTSQWPALVQAGKNGVSVRRCAPGTQGWRVRARPERALGRATPACRLRWVFAQACREPYVSWPVTSANSSDRKRNLALMNFKWVAQREG
jgi:hypothetical protein